MQSFGKPGNHASTLGRAALMKTVGCAGAGAVLALIGLSIGALSAVSGDVSPTSVAGVILIVAASGLVVVARRHWGDAERAWVGARSERRVASVIKKAQPTAVVHGALIGGRGGDVDHAVIGPWLVAVETKTGTGPVSIRDGKVVAGRRTMPGNPVAQAQQSAVRLGRMANQYASAVLCISDMTGRPFKSGTVVVCSPTSLPDVLASLPHVFANPTEASTFAERIEQASEHEQAARARR